MKLGRRCGERNYKQQRVQQIWVGTLSSLNTQAHPTAQPVPPFLRCRNSEQLLSETPPQAETPSATQWVSSGNLPPALAFLPSLASLFTRSISYLVPWRILLRTHASADLCSMQRVGLSRTSIPQEPPLPSPALPPAMASELGTLTWQLAGSTCTARLYIIFHEHTSDVSWGVRHAAVRGRWKPATRESVT